MDISLSDRCASVGGGGKLFLSVVVSPFFKKSLGETGGGGNRSFSSLDVTFFPEEVVEFVRKTFGKTGGGGGGSSGEGMICFGNTAGGGLGRGSSGNAS